MMKAGASPAPTLAGGPGCVLGGLMPAVEAILGLPLALRILLNNLNKRPALGPAKLLQVDSPVGDAAKIEALVLGYALPLSRVGHVCHPFRVIINQYI